MDDICCFETDDVHHDYHQIATLRFLHSRANAHRKPEWCELGRRLQFHFLSIVLLLLQTFLILSGWIIDPGKSRLLNHRSTPFEVLLLRKLAEVGRHTKRFLELPMRVLWSIEQLRLLLKENVEMLSLERKTREREDTKRPDITSAPLSCPLFMSGRSSSSSLPTTTVQMFHAAVAEADRSSSPFLGLGTEQRQSYSREVNHESIFDTSYFRSETIFPSSPLEEFVESCTSLPVRPSSQLSVVHKPSRSRIPRAAARTPSDQSLSSTTQIQSSMPADQPRCSVCLKITSGSTKHFKAAHGECPAKSLSHADSVTWERPRQGKTLKKSKMRLWK